uniref:Uncharacterized protein n=1 Tax=Arundo donax TaxID=35708 RepID=A0A0A9C2Y5_ARUDO
MCPAISHCHIIVKLDLRCI